MKKLLSILLVTGVAGTAGFFVGCSSDFEATVPGVFSCQSDSDCIGPRYVCDTSENVCVNLGDVTTNQPQNQNQNRPETCDPDALAAEDRYPLDPPLDIQEVCDGQDNNCDGNIDVFFCERVSDCPAATDPNDQDFDARCNTTTGLCEFTTFNTLVPGCNETFACTDGAFPEIPPECL